MLVGLRMDRNIKGLNAAFTMLMGNGHYDVTFKNPTEMNYAADSMVYDLNASVGKNFHNVNVSLSLGWLSAVTEGLQATSRRDFSNGDYIAKGDILVGRLSYGGLKAGIQVGFVVF